MNIAVDRDKKDEKPTDPGDRAEKEKAMNKRTMQNYMRLVSDLNLSYEQEKDAALIHRHTSTLHRIDENSCNGHPKMKTEVRDGKTYRFEVEDEKWAARDEKKEANLEKRIREICAKHGWSVEFQGDPRGWRTNLTINGRDASLLANY
jgi:hypothetical protein